MTAIVTDKLRLNNCSNFIKDIGTANYYIFIGLPNATTFDTGWDSNPPAPIDNVQYINNYRDTILGVKKISSSDVIRVIPKVIWKTGRKYDMYRHDYSVYNTAPITSATRLYDSLFYVMNKDYRVYICLSNGSTPANANEGVVSTEEPLHTDTAPRKESDGYVWKYLYTISPSDVLKFDSTDYISVPSNWETSSDVEISRVRDNAVSGKIETVLIEKQGKYNFFGTLTGVPIKGDGLNGVASITFNEDAKPISVEVTNGGQDYTYATLDLEGVLPTLDGDKAIFNVIIPPPGGHGKNPYEELGATRVLIYSRIENNPTDPDFIVGNQFSRLGIVKDIRSYGTNSTFNQTTGSGVFAMRLTTDTIFESVDSIMTQDSTKAVGNLVSFDSNTQVLRYIQPGTNLIDTYATGNVVTFDYHYADSTSGIQSATTYQLKQFDNGTLIEIGPNSYTIDSTLNGNTVTVGSNTFYLGQNFTGGMSVPDINTKSGEILYVDNRSSVTRASQQREDIKIVLEF
jgi:hypothetical protein